MNRHIIQYDGSFDGLLSAVFHIYAHKLPPESITLRPPDAAPQLFAQETVIATCAGHAQRVFARLEKHIARRGIITLLYGFLSNDDAMPDTFLQLVQRIIREPRNPLLDYGAAETVRWMRWVKSVAREKHRMEGFVRFTAHQDGLYFAQIEPRYDILPLIAPHFRRRFADQNWAVYDLQRGYGILHQDKNLHRISELDKKHLRETLAGQEDFYQTLWRQYFASATITSRINRKLQRQHMPQRYWKYLTEKQLKTDKK